MYSFKDADTMFESYNSNQWIKTEFRKYNLVILYSSNSTEDLLIKIDSSAYRELVSTSKYLYFEDEQMNCTFKERLIWRLLYEKENDFLFSKNRITEEIDNAIEDAKFLLSSKNEEQNSRYTTSVSQLKSNVNLREKGVPTLLVQINRTVAKMRDEEKYTYNEWIDSEADPYNYWGFHNSNNKNLSASDLKQLLKQLNQYQKNINSLKSGKIKTIANLQKFVEENLTAGGDQFKWFISTPFFSLDKSQRKKYIELFCVEDKSFFSRLSIAGGVAHGDLVLMLFSTCKDEKELLDLILSLEQEGKLFQILYNLKLNAFKNLSILISNVYMKYLEERKKDGSVYIDSIENGRQLYFDNSTFGNQNIETFDTKNKCLIFETKMNVILRGLATSNSQDYQYLQGLMKDIQPKATCKPLDIINFTPERDIEFEGLKLSAKQNYQLPACLVYLLYRQESIDSVIFAGLFTLQAALCLTGVGEVILAIEAGSTFGVIWTGAAVAIDTAFASTLIKEVQQDHPTYTKVVNYIVWVRIIAEFIQINKQFKSKIYEEIKNREIIFPKDRSWEKIDEVFPYNYNGNLNATAYDVRLKSGGNRPRAGVAYTEKVKERGSALLFELNIDNQLQGQGIGNEIFKMAIEDYSPTFVKGVWKELDIYTNGKSVNLIEYDIAISKKIPPEKAVFLTPTGKILERNGFGGKPEILKNAKNEVIVLFNRK